MCVGGGGLVFFKISVKAYDLLCTCNLYISLCCDGQFIDDGHTHGVWGGGESGD